MAVYPGRSALARLRGNPGISVPLSFVRFEPYVLPKRSLTGDTTERVDTRVLQAIYEFTPNEFPAFVGQQVDVFIAAPTREAAPAIRPRAKSRSAQLATTGYQDRAKPTARPSPRRREGILRDATGLTEATPQGPLCS
jgi:hypothetical protein